MVLAKGRRMTNEESRLVGEAQRVATALGKKTITRSEFIRESEVTPHEIYKYFDSFRELCGAAGLEPHRQNVKIDDDELFEEMRLAFLELGGITTRSRFNKAFKHNVDVFKRRGLTNWTNLKAAFGDWCRVHHPGFEYLGDLPQTASEGAPSPPIRRGVAPIWESSGRRQFGEILNFRGLLHAPVNEMGVVFLFGMVARELGFVVEDVQADFPDCEAKREIKSGRWERVRIEFEFRSRSFCDHGHDPAGCDLLVCWEDNYPESPVEILELRSVIEQLKPL